jgi:hypothetical protein
MDKELLVELFVVAELWSAFQVLVNGLRSPLVIEAMITSSRQAVTSTILIVVPENSRLCRRIYVVLFDDSIRFDCSHFSDWILLFVYYRYD